MLGVIFLENSHFIFYACHFLLDSGTFTDRTCTRKKLDTLVLFDAAIKSLCAMNSAYCGTHLRVVYEREHAVTITLKSELGAEQMTLSRSLIFCVN